MAKPGIPKKILDLFEKDVLATAEIADEFIERAGPSLIDDLIREAGAGRGPDNVRFPAYSTEYKKRKDGAVSPGEKFMHGIKKGGLHMLDKANFAWKALSKLTVQLVWTAAGNQADYAGVHQDGEGKMPKRTWMHLEGKATTEKIIAWIKRIIRGRAAEFNNKWR
tara:strand:- start:699 stop:1193 length:495 start_codon:yes stop_codon:yes gene_type:complete